MKNIFIKVQKKLLQIPLALTAVALGLTTLGTGWGQYTNTLPGITFSGSWVQYVTIVLASILLVLSLLKVISNPKWFIQEMKSGSASSHLPVLFMIMMAVGEFAINESKSLTNSLYYFGLIIWFIALILQLLYLGWWLVTRIMWFDIKEVDGAWYVPAVGIPVACAIAPNVIGLQYTAFLQGLWYIGFAGFIILTCLILYRYLFVNPIHTVELPAIGIIAAPASLLLVTYFFDFVSVNQGQPIFMLFLAGLAITLTLIVYISIFKVFQGKFNPGMAAYSFPLAIGAVARIVFAEWLKLTFTNVSDNLLMTLKFEGFVELVISSIIMIYLLIGFTIHTTTKVFINNKNLPKIINYFV